MMTRYVRNKVNRWIKCADGKTPIFVDKNSDEHDLLESIYEKTGKREIFDGELDESN